jgi:hypothetical protein
MRFLLLFAALLVVPPARADETAKPNMLTPKEVSEGWILLWDGETTFGWQIDGEARVKDGTLEVGGDKTSRARCTTQFRDFDLNLLASGPARLHFETVRILGSLALSPAKTAFKLQARARLGGVFSLLQNTQDSAAGTQMAEISLSYPEPSPVGIYFEVPAGERLRLSDIKLKPVGQRHLFNGKDLTGWREFPGRKSKFSVTPEGWLNIKNGNGDLQTEGQWADFVLQIECRCNGDHLNSGVFFRCRPGEYQQGYEAQIHNHFTSQPQKEYTIEEYDPATNELKEKKKVKFAAVDYGTGAIYRRQPARREVAKDREWFTMTIAAQGRHMATWVNGIQVTDWTDNRPRKDNARNGCYLEKGPISLQGHDPTTDISFRNIRIAELPGGKP